MWCKSFIGSRVTVSNWIWGALLRDRSIEIKLTVKTQITEKDGPLASAQSSKSFLYYMWPEKGDGWLLHVFQIKSMTVRSHTCVVCYRSIWFYLSFIHGLQKIKPHRKQSTLHTRSMVTCRNVRLGLDKVYGTMIFYDCIFQEKVNWLLVWS